MLTLLLLLLIMPSKLWSV